MSRREDELKETMIKHFDLPYEEEEESRVDLVSSEKRDKQLKENKEGGKLIKIWIQIIWLHRVIY